MPVDNNFFNSETKNKKKKLFKKTKEKIPVDIENIIREAEKTLILERKKNHNLETPLVLENEIPISNTINSFNYKIKIKSEVKDRMINELYTFLKKKN